LDCQHCSSPDTVLRRTNKTSKLRQYCRTCNKWTLKFGAPKILLFDIETSRTKFDLWRTGEQRVRWDQIDEEMFILSWAGKWLFGNEVLGDIVTPAEAKRRDGKRVVKSIYKLLKEADCVISHNGNSFDIKQLNWQFLKYDLPPLTKYQSVDTYRKSKQIFGAPSLALDYIAHALGYDGKHETEQSLWKLCEKGDKPALERMLNYNKQDVFILEDVYMRIRGWMKTHPNFGAFVDMYDTLEKDENRCPRCTQVVNDSRYNRRWQSPAGYFYKAATCKHCGTELRKTYRMKGKK
jgi:hypothetical protein